MRVEIGGIQITDRIVEVLECLQNDSELKKMYVRVLDEVTRGVILDLSVEDPECDREVLCRLRTLQMIRRDLLTLSLPPDADLPENDVPAVAL